MKRTSLHLAPFALLALGGGLRAQGEILRLLTGNGPLAAIPDIDGDGRRELMLSQPGHVRIFSVVDGQLLRSHPSPPNVLSYGANVSALDDVDGDGIGDYAIAAPEKSSALPSFVEFRSGASGALILNFVSPGTQESLGLALASVLDVDLDGVDDVLISARTRTIGLPSRVYLVSGANGAVRRTHLPTVGNFFDYGTALARLGDVDGDGRSDYAITDNGAGMFGVPPGAPTIEVFSGATGALVYRIAATMSERAGSSIVGLGDDVDGDGFEDFAVGAPSRVHQQPPSGSCPIQTGSVDIHSGATGAVIRSVDMPDLNFGSGVEFGSELAALGDINGNGSPDFAASYGFAGCSPSLTVTCFLDGLTGNVVGRRVEGFKIAAAGDLNFDGRGDVFIRGERIPPFGSHSYYVTTVQLGGVRWPNGFCVQPSICSCDSWASVEGSASASLGPELELVAHQLPPERVGRFFWGTAPTALPFGLGTLCIASPLSRLPISSTGAGQLRTTFSRADLAANGLLPGSVFYAQAWVRANVALSQPTQLSSAIQVTLWP
jgi:hypothetical protein